MLRRQTRLMIEGAAEATALIVKVFSGALSDALGKRKGLALFRYGLGAATKPLFAIAYPFGKLSDRMDHRALLACGVVVLVAADLLLGVALLVASGVAGLLWDRLNAAQGG